MHESAMTSPFPDVPIGRGRIIGSDSVSSALLQLRPSGGIASRGLVGDRIPIDILPKVFDTFKTE